MNTINSFERYLALANTVRAQNPADGCVQVKDGEYTVTKPIQIRYDQFDSATIPLDVVTQDGPRLIGTYLMPGTHVHSEFHKGDEVRLEHRERSYSGTSLLPIYDLGYAARITDETYVSDQGKSMPAFIPLVQKERFVAKTSGLGVLGHQKQLVQRDLKLQEILPWQRMNVSVSPWTTELRRTYQADGQPVSDWTSPTFLDANVPVCQDVESFAEVLAQPEHWFPHGRSVDEDKVNRRIEKERQAQGSRHSSSEGRSSDSGIGLGLDTHGQLAFDIGQPGLYHRFKFNP